MYSVLIQDKRDKSMYKFLQVKQEIMNEVSKEVTDPDTNEVRTEIEYVGTGKFETVNYKESEKDKFEAKCIELLNSIINQRHIPLM